MLTPWDPLGYKVAHFRQARRRPLTNSQTAGGLWQFRWGSALGLCYVTRVTLKGIQNANVAAATELRFNLTVNRAFTVADTTNSADILRAGDMQQLNTAFAPSLLSQFREFNSATAMSGGTKTADTDPLCIGAYSTVTTPTVDGAADTLFDFEPYHDGDQPLRLNANEGFNVNLEANAAADASSFIVYLEVCWVEATKPTTTVGGL